MRVYGHGLWTRVSITSYCIVLYLGCIVLDCIVLECIVVGLYWIALCFIWTGLYYIDIM